MWKKKQVVMLSNEKVYIGNCLAKDNFSSKLIMSAGETPSSNRTPQHLYILSDEDISNQEYGVYDNKVVKIVNNVSRDEYEIYSKNVIAEYVRRNLVSKVIATTNPELILPSQDNGKSDFIYLPKISQDFIEAYIKSYNEGNPIKEVMVEYIDNGSEEWQGDDINGQPFWNERIELKLRPDNTIIINKVKEKIYSRNELQIALKQAWKDSRERCIDYDQQWTNRYKSFDEWFNINYPK